MVLLDPTVQHFREQPTGLLNKVQSFIKRNLSEFEIEKTRMNGRKCSICKKNRYNIWTCPDYAIDKN
ncbi:17664_t:CDS:2 [Cetraspora pellucida]|uniref:17664_t:CDS:1 n=1 Tax=Cetraspora pellucida TaxID=1433469 RepID=A0A9N9H3Y3_9GLOM|nr:17664_t:CDS:2 [Cetraspora pellucida]